MASVTISGLTAVSSGNLTGTAVVPSDDANANTRKATLAQVRTNLLAGGTGFTASDPLVVGPITATTGAFSGALSGVTTLTTSGAINGQTISSAASFTGTLAVTGAATLASTLAVTGAITGSLTGNASTATALATPRAINGVNFDGTAAITVTAAAGTLSGATLAANVLASSLTSVGTLAALTVTAPITGSVTGASGSTTGNAATATALATPRAINGVNFDGTAAITVTAAAGTLTGVTLAAGVTASSLTSHGTLVSGAVPASLVTAGTFGTGAYTFPGALAITGALTGVTTLATSGAVTLGSTLSVAGAVTLSGAVTFPGTGIWNASGNVGIGTTAPASFGKFAVRGAIAVAGITGNVSGHFSDAALNSLHISHESGFVGLQSDAGMKLWVASTAITAVTILTSGNVGIGTTSPASKLDVVGTASFSSTLSMGGVINLKNYTVATLPAGTRGDSAYVTDALTPTYMTALVGGGSVVARAFYNGTAWTSA